MVDTGSPAESTSPARPKWKQDPDRVRENILAVAQSVFAEKGLSGARVEEIAARTETSKRMIYYYFGSKDGLYAAVLERAYEKVRSGEQALNLDSLTPVAALRRLVRFTFDHHARNPEFIRLVMIENIHHARYMRDSPVIKAVNRSAIERLEQLCARGVAGGVFRDGLSATDLHWFISAMSFFNVSNRFTFASLFGAAPFEPDGQASLKAQVTEMVLRAVLTPEALVRHLAAPEA